MSWISLADLTRPVEMTTLFYTVHHNWAWVIDAALNVNFSELSDLIENANKFEVLSSTSIGSAPRLFAFNSIFPR